MFSGSLAALASHADLVEVLTIGMLVPCFTWVVQLGASAFALPPAYRRLYWGDLGRIWADAAGAVGTDFFKHGGLAALGVALGPCAMSLWGPARTY